MALRTSSSRALELRSRRQLLADELALNTTGFAALPDELYLEIVSYSPPMPVPTEEQGFLDLRERRCMLSSLTQTCRSLRRVFLAYLWERIEVYDGMVTPRGALPFHVPNPGKGHVKPQINKQYAEELVRQLETVTIRDPRLAEYVNILNVVVTDSSVQTVLLELARCLRLLPNLHTVQLVFGFNAQLHGLEDTFISSTYPQIRTVCLSPQACTFVRSCPNIRRVTAYQGHYWGTYFDPLISNFANVETLGITYSQKDVRLKKIVHAMPKLRDISLDVGVLRAGVKKIQILTTLSHLRTIRIKLNLQRSLYYDAGWSLPLPVSKDEIAEWTKEALKILCEIIHETSDLVQRRVLVTYPNGEIKSFAV